MNKKSLLSLFLFAATTVLSFTAMQLMSLCDISKWVGVSVGLTLFIVMLIIMLVSKQRMWSLIAALAVNAVADGLATSSLFVYLRGFPVVWQTATVAIGLIGLFALYLLVTYIPFARKHYIISMTVYALLIVGGVIAWCATATQATKAASLLTILHMIIFIAFFIPLADNAHCAEEHIKTVAHFSFAGIIVAIIVLIVISDGSDLPLDGLSDIGGANANKKRNPYAYLPYDYASVAAAASAAAATAKYGAPTEIGRSPFNRLLK